MARKNQLSVTAHIFDNTGSVYLRTEEMIIPLPAIFITCKSPRDDMDIKTKIIYGAESGFYEEIYVEESVDELDYYSSEGEEALPDPLEILGNKIEFWFDNSDASTITLINTNEVDSQADKTGNFTRTPNTDSNGNRPTYNSARKEVFYDGAVGGLVLQGVLSNAAKAGGEIFVVARRRNNWTATVPTFFAAYDTGTTNRWCLLRDQANDVTLANRSIALQFRNGATVNNVRGNQYSVSDKVNIFNYRIDPGVEYILDFDDRGVIGETATSGNNNGSWIDDLPAFTKASFGFFQAAGTPSYNSYYELEFLYCNEILTPDERDAIYLYLNNKHNAYSEDTDNIGVVLWGQSNAVGQGVNLSSGNRIGASNITNLRVWTATNTFTQAALANMGGNDFGVDMSLLMALGEYKRNAMIYMVKVAVSGSPLAIEAGRDDFNIANSGELYDDLETRALELQAALDGLGANKIFTLLIQGERDAREVAGGEPAAYEGNLNNILNALAAAGFNADYHIINKLHDDLVNSNSDPSDPITEPNLQTVQAAQEAVVAARANALLLDLNNFDLDEADFTHYDGPELVKIGEYVFSQILQANEIIP